MTSGFTTTGGVTGRKPPSRGGRRGGAGSPPRGAKGGSRAPQRGGEVARGGNPALLLRALPAGDLRGGALLFRAQRLDVLQQLAAAFIHLEDVVDQQRIGAPHAERVAHHVRLLSDQLDVQHRLLPKTQNPASVQRRDSPAVPL